MASILVIYNPVAGRMRVQALWPEIESALRNAGVSFDAVATQAPLEATEIARSAVGKYAALVGVGGDGTVSEIVNGLLQVSREAETAPLGIVPLGNGDDFAKILPPQAPIGGRCYDWRAAVQKIAAGRSALYDVGRISCAELHTQANVKYRYFVNVIDVGFGAHTVRNFAGVPKFLHGNAAYLAAVLKTMIHYPALRMRMQFDDAPAREQVTTMTAIGNGRCFGGGFWVCPHAMPDDGLLDVMVAEQITRRKILRLLPKLQRGTHIDQPEVRMSRAHRIILTSDEPFLIEADGEMPIEPTDRLEVDLLPDRLRLIV
jgi:YegS/Rv2252/BmrU family lipid kinase